MPGMASTDEQWRALRDYALLGFSDAVNCKAMIANLEAANAPTVPASINERGAALAALLIRDCLATRLLLIVCRAYAPVQKGRDKNLRAAIGILRGEHGLGAVKSHPHWREEVGQHLQFALDRFDELRSDPRLERLKHVRDKSLAHLGRIDPNLPAPSYADMFSFTNDTCAVWEALALGTEVIFIRVADQVAEHEKHANAFWSALPKMP